LAEATDRRFDAQGQRDDRVAGFMRGNREPRATTFEAYRFADILDCTDELKADQIGCYAFLVATKVHFLANVPADRVVKLPDDVPVGPAEIVVLTRASEKAPVDRVALVRELQRTSPRQTSDSADLLRADRDAR
jgi:hypothetical protein